MNKRSEYPLNILIVNAISTDTYNARRMELLQPGLHHGTHLEMVSIDHGFPSLEYMNEEMVNAIYAVDKVVWGEENGFNAVLINCFFDPGLYEAREKVSIPVVGAGEASLCLSARLGHKFAVLATSEKSIPKIERSIERYHLDKDCSEVLSLGIGVPRLQEEGLSDEISAILRRQIDKAMAGGAEAITVGCTASIGIGKLLSQISPIPVIDPAIVSLKITEMMGSLYRNSGLSHGKTCSYAPKEVWQAPK